MSLDATAGPAVSLTAAETPTVVPGDVRVCRTVEEVEALREHWAGFTHPDADLDVFLHVIRDREDIVGPHVVVIEREGRPAALLAARLEACELPAKFGYATVLKPRLRRITVVTGGVSAPPELARELADALLGALRRREADAIELQRIEVGSPLHRAVVERAPAALRQRFAAVAPHHVMDLPASSSELLPALSKSVRDNLKRYSRKLEREYGDRLSVRRFERPEELDQVIADLETVAATTYQRGLGAGFTAEHDGPLTRIGLDGGWFRTWVLYLDGVPCAFEIGHLSGESLIISAKGFDPEYGRLHVGKVLQLKMLEDLCDDPAVQVLDFGFGDAEYKQKLATRTWEDTDVLVFGRTVRALRAAAGRTAVLSADRLARRAAGADRIAKIKRRWRDRRTPATG
jgi:CelD/BcsL family acetyltransferase involved in cellulose biosynthesis